MGYIKPETKYIYEVFVPPIKIIQAMKWVKEELPSGDWKWQHLYAEGTEYKIGTTFLFMEHEKEAALKLSKHFSTGGIL